MQVGMLWLDDDKKRHLDEKVRRAVAYYEQKYGRLPELCLVNAQEITDEKKIDKVMVKPARAVLRHHFWLGMQAE